MKQFLKNNGTLLISICILLYLVFKSQKANDNAIYNKLLFEKQQKELIQKIDSVKLLIDSLKYVRETIKERYTIIQQQVQERKDEIERITNIDTLIYLFNARIFSSPQARSYERDNRYLFFENGTEDICGIRWMPANFIPEEFRNR